MSLAHIKKVGFIGLGIMGAPIAGHILDAGYELVVNTRSKSKADSLIARGAVWADSPAACAKEADVIFTMVGYPHEVEDIYLGKDGILDAAPKGAWMVDLTTSSPELARELSSAAEVINKHALDCPVTGGEQGAIDGTLTLMIGATKKDAEPLLDLLRTFSSKQFYFGGAGKGQAAKLCNQVSLASCMVGYADALALAEQEELDTQQVLDLLQQGMGGSVAAERLAPKSLAHDYKPGFLVEHLRKDLALALREAEEVETTLPGAQTAFELYDLLCELGGERLGTQALSLLYATDEEGKAAGLDWSILTEVDEDSCTCAHEHGHDGCSCEHEHGHDGCGCEHEHGHSDAHQCKHHGHTH